MWLGVDEHRIISGTGVPKRIAGSIPIMSAVIFFLFQLFFPSCFTVYILQPAGTLTSPPLASAVQCSLIMLHHNDVFWSKFLFVFPERGGDTDVSQCHSHDEKQKSK